MTTGDKTVDSRASVTKFNTDCFLQPTTATGLVGKYWKKVWSGVDSPKQTIPSPRYMEVYSYNVYNKDGAFLKRKVSRCYYPRQKRTPRKFTNENPYDCRITTRGDLTYFRNTYCGTITPVKGFNLETNFSSSTPNYCQAQLAGLWTAQDDQAMYGKLGARLGSGFNLGTFLGEGRESLKTITESSTRIYKALRAAKKGNFLKAWNALRGARNRPKSKHLPPQIKIDPGKNRKNLADNWLQLQYGWMPLLNDIDAAMKHLAYTQNRDFTRTYRVRHSHEWEGEVVFLHSYPYEASYGGEASKRRQWKAKVTSIDQARLLGLSNPSATAWELVPWSFIVDWFIPIGNYLESMNIRDSLSGTYVISYLDRWETHNVKLRGLDGKSDYYESYFNVTDTQTGRILPGSLPKPQLPEFKSLRKIATWKHAANAVALILSLRL